MRLAGGVPQRVIEKRRTRRVPSLEDVQGTSHAERGNAGGLGVTGDQSHGLMADRSDGNQQREIGFFRQEAFSELKG